MVLFEYLHQKFPTFNNTIKRKLLKKKIPANKPGAHHKQAYHSANYCIEENLKNK